MLGEDLSLVVLRNTLRGRVIPFTLSTRTMTGPVPARYPSGTRGGSGHPTGRPHGDPGPGAGPGSGTGQRDAHRPAYALPPGLPRPARGRALAIARGRPSPRGRADDDQPRGVSGSRPGPRGVVVAWERHTWWCPEPDSNRHARSGAARFKLAVSAFHHPGRPWAPLRGSEPIGDPPAASGGRGRSCLILLAPEGASALGTRRQHVPTALRVTLRHARGMTEFHRRNRGAPPVPRAPGSGSAVIPRYDAAPGGPSRVALRNRSSG
jgi:hypothetical protein